MNAMANRVRELPPAVNHGVKRLCRFGVVLDRMHIWAGEDEVRLELGLFLGETGEAHHHAGRVLQGVPPRNLYYERSVKGRHRPKSDDIGATIDAGGRPVEPDEGRHHLGGWAIHEPCVSQDGACYVIVKVLVLWREGVDRWRDYHAPSVITDIRHVVATRENGCDGLADVWRQENPSTLCLPTWYIGADVASPNDNRSEAS